ncbi:MAG: PrsW family intramembrane metalloprotease [Candidatus Riflebacteria bacterium]|nr:PrsW family intramembrane metalloprotease [Candidatus Riflebacteria bacterium]
MSLELVVHFAIALVPGLFWLTLLALRLRSDWESRKLILKVFVLGMAVCIPAGFLNEWLGLVVAPGGPGGSVFRSALLFLFVVGPNEEILKFVIVWSQAYRRWRFRTEMDGIIFATASALGFATFENAHYMERFGIQVLLVRAWACTLGHLCFSGIFGYYLGLAKAKRYNPRALIVEGLALAAFFHGLYDLVVSTEPDLIYVVVPLLAAYYLCLTRRWVPPLLSVIAPGWMKYSASAAGSISFQRRRFLVQHAPKVNEKVLEILEQLGSVDEKARLAGLGAAGGLLDQRLFEKVHDLTHDPVEAVRVGAERLHKELKQRLREGIGAQTTPERPPPEPERTPGPAR